MASPYYADEGFASAAPPYLGQGDPCPRCGGRLDLHQPQKRRPERLLGTCDDCGLWLVFDLSSRGGCLPLAEHVRSEA